MKKKINVAIVDSCEFTAIGLETLISNERDAGVLIECHSFTSLQGLYQSIENFNIIIYDPLHTEYFNINLDNDIATLKETQPHAQIYIYSSSVGFIEIKKVDGMFNKSISLEDLKALWQLAINKYVTTNTYVKGNIAILHANVRSCLTNEEVSVMRGYSGNLKTKQIAGVLGCNVKLIYVYKKNAMIKLAALPGPDFYQNIRCILN